MKILLFSTILLFQMAIAADVQPTITKTRTCSEDEFTKEVVLRLNKKMKQIGRAQIEGFAAELIEKEKQLNLRELEIRNKEETLVMNSKDFEDRIKKFQESQNKFIGCVDTADQQVDKRVKHTVEIVSGMKPQQAADLLSVQDSDISVRILGQLPPDKVSKIFNLMNKEISARLQKQYMTMKR